jgi:hypothetical protein
MTPVLPPGGLPVIASRSICCPARFMSTTVYTDPFDWRVIVDAYWTTP